MRPWVIAASILLTASAARSAVLYDGALGTTPVEQGLSYASIPTTPFTTSGGITTLDTASTGNNAIYAGFVTASPTPLNRTSGFTIRFDIRVVNSAFASSSRAGFSVIALASDKKGIEIGFHADEIFAQGDSPMFVRAESTPFDTTAAIRRYDLDIAGDFYMLRADGELKLTGPVRDYTPFTGPIDPYETPNFLFFGDDSTSARGKTEIRYLATYGLPVPEPMSGLILAPLLRLRRRRIESTTDVDP